jgi:hypothetical protein
MKGKKCPKPLSGNWSRAAVTSPTKLEKDGRGLDSSEICEGMIQDLE